MSRIAGRSAASFFGLALSLSLVAAVIALAPATGAPKPDGEARVCEQLDGKYENGAWVGGVAAPGIDVTAFSDEQVVLDVIDGYTLIDLCVKTGKDMNIYTGDAELPVRGPATVTLTKAGPGYGIGHVSFDTELSTEPEVTCPTVDAPAVTFAAPEYIDTQRAGGEPVSVVAEDGSISVSAHAGTTHIYKDPQAAPGAADFAVGYFNQTLNWRSTDGGETWEYIGLAGLPAGPHSATSTGFSDPDFAIDQGGNIYNVEIDLANVAVFKSNDDGQSYATANPEAWFGDRPWLTALEEDEVFLYVNLPKAMLKSIDGGVTWIPVTNTPGSISPQIGGKAIPDPLNPDNGLIGPRNIGQFSFGTENDAPSLENPTNPTITWENRSFGPMGPSRQFFGTVAADSAGNVYQAAAGGYGGSDDVTPNGRVTFGYFERGEGTSGTPNSEPIEIPIPSGDALWPWVIAGDDGRAAVVWYQNFAGEPEEFYAFVAVTHNAHGTTVTCSDGSTQFVAPRFTVINASQRPMFVGNICLSGTTCNAERDFKAGDRRLGDFFTVNFDHEGNLFIVSADTMIPNPLGGPKPVGNPIFIKQDSGPPMLEEPRELRPTRCLMNLPVC
jgi:hypothetical protein